MTVHNQRLFFRNATKDHSSSYSSTSSGSAGSKVAFSGGCVWAFFEEFPEGVPGNPKRPGNATHAGALAISCQDAFDFSRTALIFGFEHARLATLLAEKLLITSAVFAIFDEIRTFATWASVNFFFDNHVDSLP